MPPTKIHPAAFELAELLRPAWAPMSEKLRASGVPLNEGEDPPKEGDPPKEDPPKQDPPKEDPKGPTQEDIDKLQGALDKERGLRRAAEAKVPKTDPPKQDDPPKKDDGPSESDKVTAKLRNANLKAALADEGITGPQALAARRLLDGVEYDDDDEPTNLADALTRAEETFGAAAIRGGKPKPPKVNSGGGGGGDDKPKLTADELLAAKAAGMTPEEYQQYQNPQPQLGS